MSLDPDDLLERLPALTAGCPPARFVVAFSGGLDSTVLLHALATSASTTPLLAVHIDHGLHAESGVWREHCRNVAAALGVAFASRRVAVAADDERGPEAAARAARYAALREFVGHGECLLSAHHENDQAETLLLNLLRGSGPAGLAGIGDKQSFARGMLLRPLLGTPVRDIEEYAHRHALTWLDDPSNSDTRFDRNFLRSEVLPMLEARWPAAQARLRRSAELLGEAQVLLEELADADIETAGRPACLSIAMLSRFSAPRQRNLLRRAVRRLGLLSPPSTRLEQIVEELMPARPDAQPRVSWSGAEVRRYQDQLYILPIRERGAGAEEWLLAPGGEVSLGVGLGSLALEALHSAGIDPAIAAKGLRVGFRAGGEKIRLHESGVRRPLKKLLQESGILPWMRDQLPLLYAGDELVAVADLWISADHVAVPGLTVKWRDRPPIEGADAL